MDALFRWSQTQMARLRPVQMQAVQTRGVHKCTVKPHCELRRETEPFNGQSVLYSVIVKVHLHGRF